jgi:DNA-binding transcriptional ArsR family regulator
MGERAFGDIAEQFEMSRPAVSQHLKVLRDADIVTVRADAQRRIYSLSDDGLEEVDAWLQKVRRYWLGPLDKLEQALRDEEERT